MRPIFPVPMMPAVFPIEIETHQAVEREIEFAHSVVCAVGLSIEGENERDGVLGHGVGRVAWDPGDGNA